MMPFHILFFSFLFKLKLVDLSFEVYLCIIKLPAKLLVGCFCLISFLFELGLGLLKLFAGIFKMDL